MVIFAAAIAGLRAFGDLEVAGGFGADAFVGQGIRLDDIFYCLELAAIFRIRLGFTHIYFINLIICTLLLTSASTASARKEGKKIKKGKKIRRR